VAGQLELLPLLPTQRAGPVDSGDGHCQHRFEMVRGRDDLVAGAEDPLVEDRLVDVEAGLNGGLARGGLAERLGELRLGLTAGLDEGEGHDDQR
jgi:hypothetical protein